MATTMYEKMMERLVDRIEHQAVDLANAKQEAENLKKELAWMKEQWDKTTDGARMTIEECDRLRSMIEGVENQLNETRKERDNWHEAYLDALREQEPFEQLAETLLALELGETMGLQRLQDEARRLLYPEKRKKLEIVS